MKKLSLFCALFCVYAISFGQTSLSPELLWEFDRLSDEQVSPDGKMMVYGLSDYTLSTNKSLRSLYLLPVAGGTSRKIELEKSAYNARWRPDGKKIGFLSATEDGFQLFEINPDGSGLQQASTIAGGIDNFSYAPDGKHVSFTQLVKTGQTVQDIYPDLPLAKARIIDDLMYRHWDEWDDYMNSHVMFAPYADGKVDNKVTDIMQGEPYDCPQRPFGGGEDIVWSPDGKSIVYVSKKLQGKEYAVSTNSQLYRYDLASGKTTLLTEGMNGYDTHPSFSPDGKKLAWLSMKNDGFESDKNDIVVRDLQSGIQQVITEAYDGSASTFSWAANSQKIYFVSGINATFQFFEADLAQLSSTKKEGESTGIKQISSGTHDFNTLSVVGNQLIGSKTSMSAPADLFAVDTKTGKETTLTSVNKETLSQIKMGKVEKRMVPTTDGKQMLVWVVYPPDFDPAKKYPTLLYCQGGPQSAVSQFFSYRWNFQLMAAKGYIVVAPNRRGLPSFGQEWNDAISGDWGGQAMRDYLSAIDHVAQEPFVDKDRLGAVGASYGGYSVYYLAGIHEKRFKTFISHCGLYNLESWYGSTEEMFFANWDIKGPYWSKPKPVSYTQFSPHNLVGNWDTPILVIHGEKDFRVPINQGMEAFNAAQLQGIPSRFLYFPEEGHWVLGAQNGVLWHRVFFEWLDETLK
ncbi:S9 family peptidase [Cytophagales bacterium LB-30]|uniref:S9 family peptidase n=1 Tax=Shiella aurantiaca TaxID=3058365 RepID=A0ABT8F5W2_9BACT|nr:S9 family peptidase [Shiella aurantiaca]MDN4165835.1 S9 family peptidase [Shiella aurantiaca]